jgi:hypothetical protein
MFFSFAYLVFRALLGLIVSSRRGPDIKDIELMVRLAVRRCCRLIAPLSRGRSLPLAALYPTTFAWSFG